MKGMMEILQVFRFRTFQLQEGSPFCMKTNNTPRLWCQIQPLIIMKLMYNKWSIFFLLYVSMTYFFLVIGCWISFFPPTNIKALLEKEKKSPLDLKNLEMILKNHSFFKECKNTLSFSHYVSFIRSLRYRFVAKGEIVYSFGDKSEDMQVILEGSFFAVVYNRRENRQEQG